MDNVARDGLKYDIAHVFGVDPEMLGEPPGVVEGVVETKSLPSDPKNDPLEFMRQYIKKYPTWSVTVVDGSVTYREETRALPSPACAECGTSEHLGTQEGRIVCEDCAERSGT